MTTTKEFGVNTLLGAIRENAGTAIGIGILLLITGTLAVISPFVAGVSITIMIGSLMIVSGIAECILAFKAGAFGRGLLIFLLGLLSVVVGIYMLANPVAMLAAMTLVLGIYFIVSAIVTLVAAFSLKPAQGWGWVLFNSIVTFFLGFMILSQFPISGIYAIGILFGVQLLMTGGSLLGAGIFVRRGIKGIERAVAETGEERERERERKRAS